MNLRLTLLIFLFVFIRSLDVYATPMSLAPSECQAGEGSLREHNFFVAINQFSTCLDQELSVSMRSFYLQLRAQSYAEMKRPDLAIQDQKNSLGLEKPKDVWPLVMLGAYYRELKQYDLALSSLKEALNYDEDGPGTGPGMAVYYHTGWTLHEAGRYAEAIEAYSTGIPKQPDYGYALFRRALSYEALGNKVQAKRDLFRAYELTPEEGYEPEINTKLIEYGFKPKKPRK